LIRGALALAALVLAGISLTQTAAQVALRSNAQLAYTLDPRNGRAAARLSEQMLATEALGGSTQLSTQLALTALRHDPTAVEAVSTLALQLQMRGDAARSDALFAYGGQLSRRELRPQLWAIEEAVSRGDIRGALGHYDVALRTSRGAQDLLFPILENALREPMVRRPLLETLARQPVWTRAFINHVAITVSDPASTVAFMQAAETLGLPVQEAERTAVVNAIASRGSHNLAWQYYSSFRDGVQRDRSRDPGFQGTEDNPAVFDWVPRNEFGAIASIQGGTDGGALDYFTPSTGGGVLLEQVQMLPPGSYRLTGRSAAIEATPDEAPYWTLTCVGGTELGRVNVPNSQINGGAFGGTFRVRGGCPVQVLALVVPSSDRVAGSSGQFNQLQLVPVSEAAA
jgi:catechol 2,3-dioxygenase-like lactoylglutathione lyase family enzyme